MSTETNKRNIISEIARLISETFANMFSNNEEVIDSDIEKLRERVENDLSKRIGEETETPINSGAGKKSKNLEDDKYSRLLEMTNTLKGEKIRTEERERGRE